MLITDGINALVIAALTVNRAAVLLLVVVSRVIGRWWWWGHSDGLVSRMRSMRSTVWPPVTVGKSKGR